MSAASAAKLRKLSEELGANLGLIEAANELDALNEEVARLRLLRSQLADYIRDSLSEPRGKK
jgi:hypothetical protein